MTLEPNPESKGNVEKFYMDGIRYENVTPINYFNSSLEGIHDNDGFTHHSNKFECYDLSWLFKNYNYKIVEKVDTYGVVMHQPSNRLAGNKLEYSIPFMLGKQTRKEAITNYMRISLAPKATSESGNPTYYKVKTLEVEAINCSQLDELEITINGHTFTVDNDAPMTESDAAYHWLRIDLEGEERNLTEIYMTVENSSNTRRTVGFRNIRLTYEDEDILNPAAFDYERNYDESGIYSFPGVTIPALEDAEYLNLSIVDIATGSEMSGQTLTYDAINNIYNISPSTQENALKEGKYEAVYYALNPYEAKGPQINFTPQPGYGVSFQIVPVIELSSLKLNNGVVDGEGTAIPTDWYEPGFPPVRDYSNVALHGIPEGCTVYWKRQIERSYPEGTPGYNLISRRANESGDNSDAAEEASEAPEGYQKYVHEQGMNLSGGDTLYLIFEKNGARTSPKRISYSGPSLVVGVDEIMQASDNTARYYTIEGIPTTLEDAPRGGIVIKVSGGDTSIIKLR